MGRSIGGRVLGFIKPSAICVSAGLLAGCSGNMPELPSMPSLPSISALAAEAPESAGATSAKTKEEPKPVDMADMNKPGELGDEVLGKANAPVTIVEYASLSCPNCQKFHAETLPKLKKAYIDKGKVRLVFREFPIGHSSAAAALAVRCAPAKDYFKVVDKYYATQKDWVAQEIKKDDIYKVVQTFGVKRDKFETCLTDQRINDALVAVKTRGRAFGVAGTPTFFVNGKKVAGAVSFEEIQPVIEAALATPASAPPAVAQQPKPQKQAEAKPS